MSSIRRSNRQRKTVAGLIVIVAILVMAMSIGCIEEVKKGEDGFVEEVIEHITPIPTHIPAPTPIIRPTPIPPYVISPTPTPSYQELIDKALEELPVGRILFNPPEEMKVGETELVEVRITQNRTEDLTRGLEGPGEPQIKETEVSTYMKVCLTGSGFAIDPQISEAQMIESDKYTHWEFHVTPLKSGIQTLKLTYYVIIRIQGADRQKEYEVGDWEVSVKVTPMGLLKSYWQFIVGTLIAIVALIISIIGIRKKQREKR